MTVNLYIKRKKWKNLEVVFAVSVFSVLFFAGCLMATPVESTANGCTVTKSDIPYIYSEDIYSALEAKGYTLVKVGRKQLHVHLFRFPHLKAGYVAKVELLPVNPDSPKFETSGRGVSYHSAVNNALDELPVCNTTPD